MKNPKLHVLDYTPRDITEALDELHRLDQSGQLQGLMFVCKVRTRKRLVVGAAGCCVSDKVTALGAASYLFGAVMDNTFNE